MSETLKNSVSDFEGNIKPDIRENVQMKETLMLLNWNENSETLLTEQELNEIETKMNNNMKNIGIDDNFFKKLEDNSFELSFEMKELIIERFIQYVNYVKQYVNLQNPENSNLNEIDLSKIKTPFEQLLGGVMKDNERRVFELQINENKERYIIGNDTNYIDRLSNIVLKIILSGTNFNNIEMKLIPQISMGIDGYLLSNGDNCYCLETLRKIGVSTETLKPFLDEYMKNNEINSYADIDLYQIVGEKTKESLFGNKIENLESLGDITIFDCLKLYKLKEMRGKSNFEQGVTNMIKSGMLNYLTIHRIESIIKSNMSFSELPDYIELCGLISNEYSHIEPAELRYDLPDLKGYTAKQYLQVAKYMRNYNIPYAEYSNNIEKCVILYNNKVPGDAYRFLPKNNLAGNIFNDETINFRELFENENGRELYLFLSKYPQKLKNLGGELIDEISLTTEPNGYNFCFRGILEMIKSRQNLQIKKFNEVDEKTWKESRELIIKEYENMLRKYISLDKDNKGNRIPPNKTYDKVFYYNASTDEDRNGVFQGNEMDTILKNFTENFEDCSDVGSSDSDNDKNNMIEKINKYVNLHPNEKILVYVGSHGGENGESSNGRTKEDRGDVAKISPNIKIMSPRCHFGAAYNNTTSNDENYLYSLKSSVSGFSNITSTYADRNYAIKEGYDLNLGFHELEIYTRLKYVNSFSPLTENMDYRDAETGKRRFGPVGLADSGMKTEKTDNVSYT